MTITAYDSAMPQLIPASAPAVLPYGDGHNKWLHTRFPKALYRYFTVTGDPALDIADFEPGCIWPGSALRAWAEKRKTNHPEWDLTVYTDRDNFQAVVDSMQGFTWNLFLATLDNTAPESYNGMKCRAVQYTDRSGAYDLSMIFDEDWLNKP